jgi:hypothetical protein
MLALAAAGVVEFSPAVAAPQSAAAAAAAAATTTGPPTTTRVATPNTTPGTSAMPPSTSATNCTPVAPTVTSTQVGATSLGIYYSSPSGYQCGVLRSTFLTLYADSALTTVVSSVTLAPGTQKGARSFSGLSPSTDYYLLIGLSVGEAPLASRLTVRTATAPTTYVSPTRTTIPCETG